MFIHIVYIDLWFFLNNGRELLLILFRDFLQFLRRVVFWDFFNFFLLFFVEVNKIVILFRGDRNRLIFGVSLELIELIGKC